MTKQDQTPDQIMLHYHGREHAAVRCGRHKHNTLYLLLMATSKAIVTPARKSLTAPVKARGVVLHAATSRGVDIDVLEAIAWDGPGAEDAKKWSAEQCRLAAQYCKWSISIESRYTAMAAKLGESR